MKLILTAIILLINTLGYAKSSADSTILVKPVICAVSVDTSNTFFNIIYWENLDSNATKFIIYRKNTDSLVFDSIAILPAKKYNEFTHISIDWWATYTYKIQALNDSGKRSELSDEKKLVQLEALEVKDDEVVRLDWTVIDGEIADSILIWRSNLGREYIAIKKLPISDTVFFDTLYVAWTIDYRLEIIKMQSCYSVSDSSNAARIFATRAGAFFGAVGNNSSDRINVYPNPVIDVLTLNSSSEFENANINIYNTLGQLVLKNKLTQNELNVSELLQGIYNFNIVIDGMNYRGKFVKQ